MNTVKKRTKKEMQDGLLAMAEKTQSGTEEQYTQSTLNNKYGYTRYTAPRMRGRLYSDPVMKVAIDWFENSQTVSTRLLEWYCREFGFAFVREIVSRVRNYHDSYFIGVEPIDVQRVKLMRHIINTEGKR